MESVYVLEPGSYLRREGGILKLVSGGRTLDEVPAGGLKRLVLIGYVSLTGAVLDFLIQNRIETVFMTPTGRFRARLALDEHRQVALRKAQYLKLSDEAFALATAGIIVKGKITNMYRFLLLRAKQNRKEELKVAAVRLKSMAAAVKETKNLEVLRGMEGAATRIYYSVFPEDGIFRYR